MAQITATTATVTPTIGDDWANFPLNPQKVLMAYKTSVQINTEDVILYPAIAFLVDYSFKVDTDILGNLTGNNWIYWIYVAGDTATRDADFVIANNKIGEVGTGGGGGEVNTASNVGTGEGVFKQKTGVNLEFKSLIGGTGITITNNPNDLTINAGAGAVTVITPAQITADQDDYSPTGWAGATIVRLDVNSPMHEITGFAAGSAWEEKKIININVMDKIKIKHNNASSVAANRVLCPETKDYELKDNCIMTLVYDADDARWRIEGYRH